MAQTESLLQLTDSHQLTLWRYPRQTEDSPLRAWDTADILLINRLTDDNLINKPDDTVDDNKGQYPKTISIFNDQFGALACGLSQLLPDTAIASIQDSYIAIAATEQNIGYNHSEFAEFGKNIELTSDHMEDISDTIAFKIPKNSAYLEYLLQKFSKCSEETTIIAAAKATDINSSLVKLLERYFEKVSVSLTWKKSRIIELSQPKAEAYSSFSYWKNWTVASNQYQIANAPNVFARTKLDPGASAFLPHLPDVSGKVVIDLACGNGILGLMTLSQLPEKMIFVDESAMALESARKNVKDNFPEQLDRCEFVLDDCLQSFGSNSADIVLCNPPFHQQKTITDHIAWQMFNDAHKVLNKGGQLRIVGNRHLSYHIKLKRIFGNCNDIATNAKFVVLFAKKR